MTTPSIWKSTEPTLAPTVPPYIPILPEHVWGPLDGKPLKEIRAFEEIPAVGSGPFQLTEWESGPVLAHGSGRGTTSSAIPTIDEIVYHVYGNDEAMVQALNSGEIDYAYDLPPTLAGSLEGDENIAIVNEAADYHTNLAFNFGGQDEWHHDPVRHPADDRADEPPGPARPRRPAGDRPRDRQAGARRRRLPGCGASGRHVHRP